MNRVYGANIIRVGIQNREHIDAICPIMQKLFESDLKITEMSFPKGVDRVRRKGFILYMAGEPADVIEQHMMGEDIGWRVQRVKCLENEHPSKNPNPSPNDPNSSSPTPNNAMNSKNGTNGTSALNGNGATNGNCGTNGNGGTSPDEQDNSPRSGSSNQQYQQKDRFEEYQNNEFGIGIYF